MSIQRKIFLNFEKLPCKFKIRCTSQNTIFFSFSDIDLYEYFEHCIHAARLYILKESDESIPAARRHMKM